MGLELLSWHQTKSSWTQTTEQVGDEQAVEAGTGMLGIVEGCCPVLQGWDRKAKAMLKLNMARDAKNKKDFYRYVKRNGKTKQMHSYWTQVANWWQQMKWLRYSTCFLPLFSLATFLPTPLQKMDWNSKEKIRFATTWGTWMYVSLYDLLRHIQSSEIIGWYSDQVIPWYRKSDGNQVTEKWETLSPT